MNAKALLVLFLLMNVVNYVDRQVVSGVAPLIAHQFSLSNAAIGFLASAFMITYALTAVPFGLWSDRWSAQKVAAIGVALFSVFSLLSAVATSYTTLAIFRAGVGVGEAAYVATATTVLSRVFSPERRGFVLGLFNVGMPIGGAMGVVLGGWLGTHMGWNDAFLVAGVPGLILAVIAWAKAPDTQRANGETWEGSGLPHPATTPSVSEIRVVDLLALFANRPYVYTCLGYAGLTFTFGAIVFWAPTFFQQSFHYSLAKATLVSGGIQVVAGLLGAPIGGLVADRWQRYSSRGRAWSLVLAMSFSALFLWAGLSVHSIICFGLSTFFLLWHVGPASALVFQSARPAVWNTASAVAILLMHALGDIPSPYLAGIVADATNLQMAFTLLPITLLLSAAFFYGAGRYLVKEAASISTYSPNKLDRNYS